MFCANCGKEIESRDQFCSHCGQATALEEKIEIKEEKKEEMIEEKENHTNDKPKNSLLMQVLGVIMFVIAFVVGKYMGLLYFLFFGLAVLGWYLASLYSKKHSENTLTKFIAWSNVITWLLPPLGLFTASSSFQFNQAYGKKTKLYLVLAIIGLVASVINGILGVLVLL